MLGCVCWQRLRPRVSPRVYKELSIVGNDSQYRQKHRVEQIAQRQEEPASNSSANYCMNLVKKYDYENFLCTLLLRNAEQRRNAFALRAFNVEIAKSGLNVTEPHIVQMRIRFWLDAIDKCYEAKRSYVDNQPVLQELKNVIDLRSLNRVYLKRLVSARDRLPKAQFKNVEEMQQYCENAYSSVLYLLLESVDIKNIHVDHAASHLGKAQGLTNLLRAIPHLSNGVLLHIPQDLLQKHGVNHSHQLPSSKLNHNEMNAVEECVYEVACLANQHLKKARLLIDKIPRPATKFFLPAVPVDRYLERLRIAKFNLTEPNCLRSDTILPLVLFVYSLRGTF